jgi:hypothetical protein
MNSYIIVGILNTIIGYLIGVIIFYILKDDFNNFQIAIFINFITIFIAYFLRSNSIIMTRVLPNISTT